MNAVCPGSEACGSVFCRQWPENIVPDGELVGAKFGRLPEKSLSLPIRGEVLEWLKRRAWKARIRLKRIRGSNPLLSAINIENQCFTKLTPDFTPENVKSGVFCLRLTIDIGAGGSLPKVVTHRLEVDTYFTDLYSARSKGVIKNASKLIR